MKHETGAYVEKERTFRFESKVEWIGIEILLCHRR